MTTRSPVEETTRYATTVDTLPDAWQFVMAYIDRVGNRPRVTISPITIFDAAMDGGDPQELFEVVVSGMREEDAK